MRRKSSLAGAGIGAMILTLAASIALPLASSPVASAATAHVSVAPSAGPAFIPPNCGTGTPAYNYEGSGDAADPQVVYSAGTYYAFTTGNALGNNIAALVSSSPNSGYGSYTGRCYGSTALPIPSSWEAANTQTSPGVFYYDGHWVMFYDAAQSGHASDSGYDCLAVATAASISPTDVQFSDASSGPIECQATGTIDPQPFVDPSTGVAYLVWKQNDGGSSAPAYIWSQQLDAPGTGFARDRRPPCCSPTTPCRIPGRRPWRTRRWWRPAAATTSRSRPACTPARGTPRGSPRATGHSDPAVPRARSSPPTVRCSDPAAVHCSLTRAEPGGWIMRHGRAARPGARATPVALRGGSSSHRPRYPTSPARSPATRRPRRTGTTWSPRTAASSTTGTFRSADRRAHRAQQTRGGHGGDARRRGLLAGGERRGNLLLRRRPVLRLCRFVAVEQADRGHGGHAGRRWLLARGERRRHLQLRRRQVLRLSRVPPPQPADRGHGADTRRRRLLAGGERRRHLLLR